MSVSRRILTPGQVLHGKYTIEKVLGEGGMAVVYLARHENGGERAIKEVDLSGLLSKDRSEYEKMFDSEVRVLEYLDHRNVVRITDSFSETDRKYLVMRYVKGEDLHAYVMDTRKGRPVNEDEAREYLIQIVEGLEHLHDQNPAVIHRDIKPANCIKEADGKNPKIVIVDFGLSLKRDVKTGDTALYGTEGYAPLEQLPGGSGVVPKTDIYAAAATGYFILSAEDPPQVPDLPERINGLHASGVIGKEMHEILLAAAANFYKDRPNASEFLKALGGNRINGNSTNVLQSSAQIPIDDVMSGYSFWAEDPKDWGVSDYERARELLADVRSGNIKLSDDPLVVAEVMVTLDYRLAEHVEHMARVLERKYGVGFWEGIFMPGKAQEKQEMLRRSLERYQR